MIDQDGRGGRGGQGGQGGKGGKGSNGLEGEIGESGEPGELGSQSKIFTIPLATWITIIFSLGGGIWWLFGLETKINDVKKDLVGFQTNVLNLNTPLSQRVFSVEARVNEVGRIQSEVRSKLDSIDNNGTSQNKVLKRDIEILRAEIAGQNIRCSDLNRKIDELNNTTIENKTHIQNIIDAINPHETQRLKK